MGASECGAAKMLFVFELLTTLLHTQNLVG